MAKIEKPLEIQPDESSNLSRATNQKKHQSGAYTC